MKPLSIAFYHQRDVVAVAQQLIGKILHTQINGAHTSGMIVETEAYNGVVDKASHAYGNRRTQRTEIMYASGGVAYVYLCYGMHHLFNIVTHDAGTPHAVLIRAVEPLEGMDTMLKRRNKAKPDPSLTKGPGSVSKSLGIHTGLSGSSLLGPAIWLTENQQIISPVDIVATPRIGVAYAQEDAALLYRFHVRNNPYVSGNKSQNQPH
ncbi:MAG TPA: DNA-3-methyladenine glycosylase [Phnomibacter sp.]|nr:DNA-3-methyladenine glycosylase [Phnomibacter sp.]